ncbi:isopenicillin N synthase family oxygenase [Candidatus Uhrbacteria bacterium]|nr:isopenicillin N synthase family oxygenase [Candidatus Uhrbacteria bacterium]
MTDHNGLIQVDVERFVMQTRGFGEDCRLVRKAITGDGAIEIRDSRIPEEPHDVLQEMVLRYFRQPTWAKLQDERLGAKHDVGWTPPFTEWTKFHDVLEVMAERGLNVRPHAVKHKDPKERFMWRIGDDPDDTAFAALHAPQVVPAAFVKDWKRKIDVYFPHAQRAIFTMLEMLAVGYHLELNFFTKLLEHGPHLFAPTGVNLAQLGEPGTVHAALHRDIGFITAHGRSNAPGLFLWKRNGERIPARIQKNCILAQVAQQLAHVMGGQGLDGMHEVVAVKEAQPVIERMRAAGEEPWRVSTTFFFHMASDCMIAPLGPFRTDEALAKYPPIRVGDQIMYELGITGVG